MGWFSIFSSLISPVTEYVKGSQKLKAVKLDNKIKLSQADTMARIALLSNEQSHDINLDLLTVKERGIKDDVITYILLLPFLILMFNPLAAIIFNYEASSITSAMNQGFSALENMPEFLRYGMLIVMADVFGLRGMLRKVLDKAIGFKAPTKKN